ncbi:MAG: TatD family hydrolase [Patescibacteria group bacterium]|jgi:TatD DNase family protein|nr:TatD family hydrolase [Patescibacteria group bacterium]
MSIDTHTHLDFETFDEDREEVIEKFFNDNGKAIINISVNEDRIQKTLKLSQGYKNIFASVGFHPEEINNLEDFSGIEKYLKQVVQENDKIVAIGEIGLDYFHSKEESEHQKQKELFEIQLKLAKEMNLPAVLHCRDAYKDMLEILLKEDYAEIPKVLHCYCGEPEYTEKFLELENLIFSFTGNITFVKNDDLLLRSLKMIPLERVMAETDCPFLTPVPNRGKRNEPGFVRYIIEKIAEVKKVSAEEVEEKTDQNATTFFGLKLL